MDEFRAVIPCCLARSIAQFGAATFQGFNDGRELTDRYDVP
jgi:hypothetical protein